MQRDFTENEKTKLLGYVQDDQDKNSNRFAGNLIDYFADIIHYSDLDINDYLTDIDNYHKKLIDAQNMTSDKIEKLFAAVHAVDEATLTNVDMVKMLIEALEKTVEGLEKIVKVSKYSSSNRPLMLPTADYTDLANEVPTMDVVTFATMYEAYRGGDYEAIQNYIANEVDELKRDVTAFGSSSNRNDLKVRQELIVDLFRLLNPDSALAFDDLFNSANVPFDKFDRYNIMYLVYTADEPFRSIYLDTLGSYTLGDVTLTDGCFYTKGGSTDTSSFAVANTVNLNPRISLYMDPKGAYTTFFHECGHAIDSNLGETDSYSKEYEDGTNFDVIYNDVYSRITAEIWNYININPDIKDESATTRLIYTANVISAIKNNGDTSSLNPYELTIYNDIRDLFDNELAVGGTNSHTYSGSPALIRSGLSDIYGGITNNVIVDGRGHWGMADTDGDGVEDTYSYWYYPDGDNAGKPTLAQVTEMWAHYYSFGITGNTEAMNDMNDYMPSTMERYEQMAYDMVNSGD